MSQNHNSKEFRIMRSVCLWLHSFKCFHPNCNLQADQVHHNDKRNENHALINLIPLCYRCHKNAHLTNIRFKMSFKILITQLLKKIDFFKQHL